MSKGKLRYQCMACGAVWEENEINVTWDKRLKCGDFMCGGNAVRLKPEAASPEQRPKMGGDE